MEKVSVYCNIWSGDSHGFSADFVFIDGDEYKHREFKKESCPDVHLNISGYITKEEVLVELERLIKLLNLSVVNKDTYIDEIKDRLK